MSEEAMITAAQQVVLALNNLNKTMQNVIPNIQGTASSATAGAATLPADPVGFLVTTLPDGTSVRIPYYAV